jgi:cyanophycin synthetase
LAAVCRTAARWRGLRVTGVVGVPGDRSDALIRQAGRVAARGFERVVIKEDEDLRGRRPGEVAEIIRAAVNEEAPWRECAVVLDEEEALRGELRRLGAGEVVVMFYDRLEPLRRILEESGAVPVETIEGLERQEGACAAATGESRLCVGEGMPLPSVRRATYHETQHHGQREQAHYRRR